MGQQPGPPPQYTLAEVDPRSGDELRAKATPLEGSFYAEELRKAVPPHEWPVIVKERLPHGRVRIGYRGWPAEYDQVIRSADLRERHVVQPQ